MLAVGSIDPDAWMPSTSIWPVNGSSGGNCDTIEVALTPGMFCTRRVSSSKNDDDRFAAAVLLLRQRQAHGQKALRREAEIGALKVDEAAHEKPGAEKEHHRQCDLRDDERLADAAAGPRLTRATVRLQ